MKEKIQVVLVDDHALVRLGLLTLLEDLDWVVVVAEAGTAAEALEVVAKSRPDVVILDIRMPGQSGIEACAQITRRWPQTQVIMLTSYGDDELVFRALQAGAAGYVLKQVGNRLLIDALAAVRRGEALLDPAITQQIIRRIRQSEVERQALAFKELSRREMEVLALISQGQSNHEIAQALTLSEKTVRNHITTILAKLGFSNRVEATTYAIRNDIQHHLKSTGKSSS